MLVIFTNLVLKYSFLKQSLALLKSKPSYNKVLQCSVCLVAPPPTKASGSLQNKSDYAVTANCAGIVKWAQLDLQSIQHRDYFYVFYKVNQSKNALFNEIEKVDIFCNKWNSMTFDG